MAHPPLDSALERLPNDMLLQQISPLLQTWANNSGRVGSVHAICLQLRS